MIQPSIDLRSDTITRPTSDMLKAMYEAKTGDDVFAEDPAAVELQERCAALFGHESALYCPSGTMTNQIAINVHVRPGDEVVCDRKSHIYNYEGGGIARNSGASVRLIEGDNGRFRSLSNICKGITKLLHNRVLRKKACNYNCSKNKRSKHHIPCLFIVSIMH